MRGDRPSQPPLEPGARLGADGCDATDPLGLDEDLLDRLGAAAHLSIRGDPGRDRLVGAQDMERQAQLALPRVIVEIEPTAAPGEGVEVASLLSLPDDALGQRLPGRADADAAIGVVSDRGSSRSFLTGQCAEAMDGRGWRWLPQMGQVSVPAASRVI
jgi:hypothetical protein